MKIVITGCAGFIGFHLAQKMLKQGFKVVGIDNFDDFYQISLKEDRVAKLERHNNFSLFRQDINQLSKLDKDAYCIIHLAAQAGVRLPKEFDYKYTQNNSIGFKNILDICCSSGIKKVIYASSSSVYSGNLVLPYSEKHKLETPKSLYAETKIQNEMDAGKYSDKLKIIGLRFFTVYGPWGRPDMAYYRFTDQILKDEEITLFNDGKTYRDMTYIDDIVNGIFASLERIHNVSKHEIYNLGNTNEVGTNQLINIIEKRYGKRAVIKNVFKKNEVYKTLADVSKAKSQLNYSPKISINEGLNYFFDWYDSYYKK